MDIVIRGNRLRLMPAKMIGSGGEAEVYDIGQGEVVKVFKSPKHPDFASDTYAAKAAAERIFEHQTKLASWPKRLPKEVVGPTSLAFDLSGKNIVGYTMRYLTNTEVLLRYGERKYREAHNISHSNITKLFTSLRSTVSDIHNAGVVIGDFNDLNVLVDQSMNISFVDADSMQFGKFLSRVFTAKFVDPLHCDPHARAAQLIRPHNIGSDWYAYHVMLMQALLYVGPYGGIHAPSVIASKLNDWQRVQGRVTVFSSEVRYPRPALHYSILPDTILDQFHAVFERDRRDEPPSSLLAGLRFTTCPACKKVHARNTCPDCQPVSPTMTKEVITSKVEALKVRETSGSITYATIQNGEIKYIYNEAGAYYREDGSKVLDGKHDSKMRLRILGDATIFARDGEVVALRPGKGASRLTTDLFRGKHTVVDSNFEFLYIVSSGGIKRYSLESFDYPSLLGSVLPSQTMLWVGEVLGFVYAQAGGITIARVLRTDGSNLGIEVDLGRISGNVIDATTVLSDDHVWFFLSIQDGPLRLNRCYMINQYGKVLAQVEALSNDGSWLSTIHGKCAFGKQLFAPTDDGIVRVEFDGASLGTTKIFSDTNKFVDEGSRLLFGRDGVYVVSSSRIWRLRMK